LTKTKQNSWRLKLYRLCCWMLIPFYSVLKGH
jgi:hypothetical protein